MIQHEEEAMQWLDQAKRSRDAEVADYYVRVALVHAVLSVAQQLSKIDCGRKRSNLSDYAKEENN
jgi:hypothetical protein